MKAGEEFLLRYLEGHDKRFVIPVYQRNYDWKREQCQQLFDDVLNVFRQGQATYFIGSIVSIHNDDAKDREAIVIDGQQRITTISLMLLAIHNLLDSKDIESANATLKEQIKDNYLVNKYADEEKRIRLKPIKDDNQAFLKLFDGRAAQHVKNSNVTLNYDYFVGRIKALAANGTTVDQLYSAIQKLIIVDIKLKRGEDNPQLIFESLNSTGKQLEESDLVRNFILMDKPARTQEKLYEQFWNPIEKNAPDRVGDFIRDYLTYAGGKTPRKDKVYAAFKAFVQQRCGKDEAKLEELLAELLDFSRFYNNFVSFNTGTQEIDDALRRIDRLQVTVCYPFLMDVFKARAEDLLNAEDVAEILNAIESFVLRRLICGVPTHALNKLFAALGRNIRKADASASAYMDVFKYLFSTGISSNRFPADDVFKADFVKKEIYRLNKKNQIYLFERIENHDNREKVDIEALYDVEHGLSYEHIMPQALTSAWKNELGAEHERVHAQYLHTIGNATLTAYNSKMSNKPFHDKVTMEKGFKESRLWLNRGLSTLAKWDEEAMKTRAENLAMRALQIWPSLQTTYKPAMKQAVSIGLYDEYEYTKTKPRAFTFLDKDYPAGSWRDLYKETVKLLYGLDPVRLQSLFDDDYFRRYMAVTGDSFAARGEKIAEGVYLYLNLSAENIVAILRALFEKFDFGDTDYSIVLREDEDAMAA